MRICVKISSLMIAVILVFLNFAECTDEIYLRLSDNWKINVNENNITSTYLNFGQRINGNRRYLYEHANDTEEILKNKTNLLSRLLKMHIDQLRNKTDQIDLVFLVDASGSVGEENFRSELNFVTKLLSDFTVDKTAIQVAVVTFGGRENVNRNIDQISNDGANNNKCYLLNKQLNNITYDGGGTYTRGALFEALAVLEKGRKMANKVVFLITDGYSNGGDPRPAANLLKSAGAIVFTFGIRTGNVKELHDIASSPGYLYSYLLDSFAEFEALVRHALHRDLKIGQYVPITLPTECNNLCAENTSTVAMSASCCDDLATCTCGTTTGHYSCICHFGYIGSGLKGFCQPCPNGTYASASISGDYTTRCVRCPDARHITVKIPATSIVDCICDVGFTANGYKCKAITCPKLRVPNNGYLVNPSACSNVVHVACGVRCDFGYRLTGDSIRLCQKNGIWSGKEPQCLLKTCPALPAPIHGHVKYTNDNHSFKKNSTAYPIDTSCHFKCDVGYQLRGSKVRNCLLISKWDGLPVTCKAITCKPLERIANANIVPEICYGTAKVPFDTNCTITCDNGFVLEGPTVKSCNEHTEIWTQQYDVNRCVDKMPPSIQCPSPIVTETLKGQNYAYIKWTVPKVTDNADPSPSLWMKPYIVSPWKVKIGVHVIVYTAEDASGNKATCKFKVKVLDKEPPTIENCVDPPTFYTDLTSSVNNITWDEPVFYDNSRTSMQINQNHRPGEDTFPIGQTKVLYNATDKYGNSAICILHVTVKDVCKDLIIPFKNRLNCSTTDNRETRCIIACDDGYDFPIKPRNFDMINDQLLLKCNSSDHMWEDNYIAECSELQTPRTLSQEGGIIIQSNGSMICNNQTTLRELNNHISHDLKLKLLDICDNNIECDLINFDAECENSLTLSENVDNTLIRRRRNHVSYNYTRFRNIFDNNKTIIRRSRQTLNFNPDSNKNKTNPVQKREKIKIKFKFIGRIIDENLENPKRGVQKLREKIDMMMRLGKLDLFDNRTNQEIAKLALNLHLVFKKPHSLCDPGSILKKHGCVKCPAGTFHNPVTNICQSCPFGQYQNETASLKCRSCPEYAFTRRMHVKSLKDCIPICRPGYYSQSKRYHESRVSVEPCFMCDFGFYQPHYGKTKCLQCPLNMTTDNRGSIDIYDCLPIHDNETDDCRTDPCLNGGRCSHNTEIGFVCECLDYYFGLKCELFRNPCNSSPCLHNGVCKLQQHANKSIAYDCICKNNYTGPNCKIYKDECFSNPCQNGGECVSEENNFTCYCKDGFEGEFCEIRIDYCELMLCQEGSTCRVINGTWQCLCKTGFLGRYCDLLPCDWLPCHPNAICFNIEEENATRESYRCECPDGYTGEDCTIKIDYCENMPCLNNGNCINQDRNYTCDCPVLFTGRNCEIELLPDYIMHFTKSGTRDYVIMEGPAKNLTELSVCFWLQSMDTVNYGTVLSYATTSYDNAFTLTDYNGFVLYVNGENTITDIKVNDGYWHFVCVTWENQYGSWQIFVDGTLRDSGIRLAEGTVIQANGSLTVGQEQDILGGGFAESEAFLGKLTLLDLWDNVLNENNITTLWASCEKYHGNLIAWAQMQQYINGDIVILASPFCRGCPLPVIPFKGNIKVNEDLSEIIYYCDNGYVIQFGGKEHRSFKRKCLKYGQWEGHSTPICTKIKCGFPGYFPRGQIHGRSYSFGDEIYYSCMDGYHLQGNPHRICNSNGKWIGVTPICIGKTCKNLLAPENGDIEYILEENERDDVTMIQAGQELEFKCNFGYRLIGERYLTCLETGLWDYETPYCTPYGCPPPKRIKHGYMNFPKSDKPNQSSNYEPEGNITDDVSERTYYYDDVVGFSCYSGYKFRRNHNLLAEFKLQCSANGTWMGFVPDCVPRICPWPDYVENAKIFLRKQDNITIEIPMEKYTTIKNNKTNEISQEMFTSGTEVTIVCNSRYELIGNETRICTENENWSSITAFCKPPNCSIHDHPIFKLFKEWENEKIFKNSTDMITDKFNKKWDKIKNFTYTYENLEILIEGNSHGQQIVLICKNNMRMNLNRFMINETTFNITWICNIETSKWEIVNLSLKQTIFEQLLDDPTNICNRSCVPPEVPEYGYIDDSVKDFNNHVAIGSIITFKCRHGYILEGNAESICLSNGTWSASPFCKPIICEEPPILVNAILRKDIDGIRNFTFGNMISYLCVPGYRMFGQINLRCLGNGKWSGMTGGCSKIPCGKPKIQDGIMLYGYSYLFQDQLIYVCPNNKTEGIITCQADGKWNELPKCN